MYKEEEYKKLQQKLKEILSNNNLDDLERQKLMSEVLSEMRKCTDIDSFSKVSSKLDECIEYTISKIVELEIKNLEQNVEKNLEIREKITKDYVIEEFTHHFCYYLSKMLYVLFPDEASIYLDTPGGHSVVKINLNFYDIRGKVNNIIDLSNFRKIDDGIDDIEFLQHSDLCIMGREKFSEIKEKEFDKIIDIIKMDEKFLKLKQEYSELKEEHDKEKNLN